jgi:hypothetical protein
MIETYEEIKGLIEDALDSFRRNNISMVKGQKKDSRRVDLRTIQISIGGTEVWRRLTVPDACRLRDLHRIIQTIFGWTGSLAFWFLPEGNFRVQAPGEAQEPNLDLRIADLAAQGVSEVLYEYGKRWNVKIMILSRIDGEEGEPVRCSAGADAAPPEKIAGPARFKKLLSAREQGKGIEYWAARDELGERFDPHAFDIDLCNRTLAAGLFHLKDEDPSL